MVPWDLDAYSGSFPFDLQPSAVLSMFHRKNDHFTSQIVLGDRTFDYDSMINGGRLRDIGRDILATVPSPAMVLAIYDRSSAQKVSRDPEKPFQMMY